MSTPPLDDAGLERARSGDVHALSQLWLRERRWVAAVLVAHAPPGADLEDLLQEVAVTLVRRLRTLREGTRFRAWLRAVARNAARSAGRRCRPRDGAVDLDSLAAPRGAHADALHLQEVLERVASLPAELREPLLLRAMQGLTQREIAALLEVPETTVETRLARARRALRRAVADDTALDSVRRIP